MSLLELGGRGQKLTLVAFYLSSTEVVTNFG